MPHLSRAPGTPAGRRPDASMSLLTSVMEHALDDGYAEAAARRGETGRRRMPGTLRGKAVLALGLVLTALVVTVGAARTQSAAPREARDRARLIGRIKSETASADRRQKRIEELRREVETAQEQALRGGGGIPARLRLLSGDAAAVGPGIRVTVNDAPSGPAGGSSDPRQSEDFGDTGRVRDRDLQQVVNGLWQAGAEAVAVNGQRLTALSAIRAAGDAVLVDNRPLVPPYRLVAIGGGRAFADRFRDSDGGLYLGELEKLYGIRGSVAVLTRAAVPAASGATVRFAVPDRAAAGGATGATKGTT